MQTTDTLHQQQIVFTIFLYLTISNCYTIGIILGTVTFGILGGTLTWIQQREIFIANIILCTIIISFLIILTLLKSKNTYSKELQTI